uniref:Laminin, beta 4 n=1 Tax=Scleropages formosus TaxID=113540 RepID=A0A8C9WRM0_SCLFO
MVGRGGRLSATSTCGLDGPQNYCIIGHLEDEKKCFSCDSRQPYNRYTNPRSHRIENVITTFDPERRMKWWQSENGVHEVSIQLDLETVFQFSHLVLTFKSFRPSAMLVERSKDNGRTWTVFRYFAEDCGSSFPGVPVGAGSSVGDVVCDTRYSGAEPSTGGEVVLKALDPTFQINDLYSPEIQELITMTNLRVNFTRLLTLGDTLLGRRRRNPQDKYYYALYEMVVRGTCFCNGHASQCVPVDSPRGDVVAEPGMVHGRCVCQHNTAGSNCERCRDLYNDSPWRPAGHSDPHPCKKCNCNGHSERCHFDMARYISTGEVSGGVCDECGNNRVGVHCERCRPFYYRDPRRVQNDPDACVPCDCDPVGSLVGGPCDPGTGHCVCKRHVEGDRCDRCRHGFYGLSRENPDGCTACRCNPLGSVETPYPCDPVTGQCFCKPFATGPMCDRCVSGYWGLGNTVHSCLQCDCDIEYSDMCNPLDGQCPCRPNIVGPRCKDPALGYFLAPLDFYLYEAELARIPGQPVTWTGPGFVRVQHGAGLRFTVNNLPVALDYYLVLRYEPEVGVAAPVRPLSPKFERYRCLEVASQLGPRILPEVCKDLIVSMSALIHNGAVACRCNLIGSYSQSCSKFGGQCNCKPNVISRCCDTCAPNTFGFGPNGCKPCNCDPRGSFLEMCDQASGQCACRPEVSGQRCDRCRPGYFGFPLCRPCQCNGLADLCDPVSGACVDCRDHAAGPHCDRCVDGYYSNLALGEPCQPCLCPDTKASGRFFARSCSKDPNSLHVLCHCEPGHSGPRCDVCSSGFYGNLALPEARCQECQCNNNTDPQDRDSCDPVTGTCLRCLHHTYGSACESCEPGYYGNALAHNCRECRCDPRGTEINMCSPGGSCLCQQSSGQCPCQPGVAGISCDECQQGFWGFASEAGCQPCDCHPSQSLSDQCDKVTGQCPCHLEFGGRHCDECGENFFQTPDLQCISCDCNVDGTARPSCDHHTGECLCRPGVAGSLCSECAPGHGPPFPDCAICHDCWNLWAENVTMLQGQVERISAVVKQQDPQLHPSYSPWLNKLDAMLDNIRSLIRDPTAETEMTEKLYEQIKYGCLSLGPAEDQEVPCGGQGSRGAVQRCEGHAGRIQAEEEGGKRQIGQPACGGLGRSGEEGEGPEFDYKVLPTDEMVKPEDIEMVATAVLAIQLPSSPEEIRDLINKIRSILVNSTKLLEDLERLREDARTAQDLLQRAKEVQYEPSCTRNLFTYKPELPHTDIRTHPLIAQCRNDANLDLILKNTSQMNAKLNDTETVLNVSRIKDLVEQVEVLKNKTEMNRLQGQEAKAAKQDATLPSCPVLRPGAQ